jgi:hypothetical protein
MRVARIHRCCPEKEVLNGVSKVTGAPDISPCSLHAMSMFHPGFHASVPARTVVSGTLYHRSGMGLVTANIHVAVIGVHINGTS